MEDWRKDARHEPIVVDLEALVPKDHLLRKIEKVMDYNWLYERLDPYYCHDNGRPGTDPAVLIKMVLIQHLVGIPLLRQTYQRIQDTLSYRRFLGYGLLDSVPHFATVSYAFCKRFPGELSDTEDGARESCICAAQGDDRAGLCGCEGETRDALYTPPGLGRRHAMGQA